MLSVVDGADLSFGIVLTMVVVDSFGLDVVGVDFEVSAFLIKKKKKIQ